VVIGTNEPTTVSYLDNVTVFIGMRNILFIPKINYLRFNTFYEIYKLLLIKKFFIV